MSFKVGDQVKSKGITSSVAEGLVVAVYDAKFHQNTILRLPYWMYDKYFPGWFEKTVVTVQKSIPTQNAFGGSPEQIAISLQQPFITYAEDELEIVPPGHSWIDEIEKKLGE